MEKIDIRDLRVGNWLSVHHPTMPAENIPISADWIRTIEQINNGLIKEDSPLFRIVEPIPLTPDMLLTNGFELQDLGGERISVWAGFGKDNCYDVEVEFDGIEPVYLKIVGPFYLTTPNIEYLHQLQNFLKDCETGIEITI